MGAYTWEPWVHVRGNSKGYSSVKQKWDYKMPKGTTCLGNYVGAVPPCWILGCRHTFPHHILAFHHASLIRLPPH